MSLDPLCDANGRCTSLGAFSNPIVDVVVFFGGWGKIDGGDDLPDDSVDGTEMVVQKIRALTPSPFHQLKTAAIQGSLLLGGRGMAVATQVIRESFHPAGKVIIYGYSAGGTDALAESRFIDASMSNFQVSDRTFFNNGIYPPDVLAKAVGWVRIDLVVTVDGASGPFSDFVDRSVPTNVRKNVNFYQPKRSSIGSHGGPNTAVDITFTSVDNRLVAGPNVEHSTIDELTADDAAKAIQDALGYV